MPEKDGLFIEVNETHSTGKQNFSIDHDVTHTLLPTYTQGYIDDPTTGKFASRSEEELLCDIGASALLLDPRWLKPLALASGPSLGTLVEIANVFGASLQATALKLVELDIWHCAFVFWEEGFRKEERIPAAQLPMSGLQGFGAPEPKLRVSSAYCADSFGVFIPPNKSAPYRSLVARCGETEETMSGVEQVDFGKGGVEVFGEHMFAAYRAGATIRRRVISLFQAPNTPRKASPLIKAFDESL